MIVARRFVAGLFMFLAPLCAENLNVSKIVTGTQQNINFATALSKPNLANVSDRTYATEAIAAISSNSKAYFLASPWAAWQTNIEFPNLQRSEATPAETDELKYASPYYKLAAADMTSSPREVESRVFKSGSARASTSYTVKVEHFGAGGGDYFTEVKIPTITTAYQRGYSLCCPGDSNGGTYLYKAPKKVKIRTALDMYVNGLPVWSAEKVLTYGEGLTVNNQRDFTSEWDRASATGSDTLYLGRLQAGNTLVITLTARTNVDTDAPNCGTAHYGQFYTPEKRCNDAVAKIATNSAAGALVGFNVFAKAPPVVITLPEE